MYMYVSLYCSTLTLTWYPEIDNEIHNQLAYIHVIVYNSENIIIIILFCTMHIHFYM